MLSGTYLRGELSQRARQTSTYLMQSEQEGSRLSHFFFLRLQFVHTSFVVNMPPSVPEILSLILRPRSSSGSDGRFEMIDIPFGNDIVRGENITYNKLREH
jgi:hypothetical protein